MAEQDSTDFIKANQSVSNNTGNDVIDASKRSDVQFDVDAVPPWYMCIILAGQHYIVVFVSTFSTPIIFAGAMCLDLNNPDINDVVNTLFFVSGITTLLQTTIGVRLPIIQGSSFAFLPPLFAILSQPEWKCPSSDVTLDTNGTALSGNGSTLLDTSTDDIWKLRMREISGTIMVASAFQIFIGVTGLLGGILRYVGPITVTPIITIIGLSLFQVAADMCSSQWGISMLTVVLITITSQLMRNITVPYAECTSNCSRNNIEDQQSVETKKLRIRLFSLFSFLFSILLVWLLCYILTVTDVFGASRDEMGYNARTDLREQALRQTKWFRVPYPFQFGMPTTSAAGIIGMFVATMASVIESVGDYYACARVSKAPPPPRHAINRGILMEGIGCLLCGMFGTGVGSTSYSQNIAVLSITKVGSRRIIQICAVITIVMALLGKFAALFISIPLPMIGGIFIVMFGMIAAVGLSNLRYVDLSSSRNLYILGLSLLLGLSIPSFLTRNPGYIQSGYLLLDQISTVLLTTGMFIAGVIAFLLDNIVPGTREERGLLYWDEDTDLVDDDVTASMETYDVPFIGKLLRRWQWTSYLPFCQTFKGCCCRTRHTKNYDIAKL